VSNQDTSLALDCGGTSAPGAFGECDDKHRVNLTTDPGRPIEEPYAMAIDAQRGLLYVGHLRGGYLSSIDLDAPGGSPKLVNVNPGIFPGDINGSTGVTSLTLTSTGINTGRIYATSRYVPRAGAFVPISYGQDIENESTFLANAGDVFVSPLPGSEMRGIQPIPLTHRTYVLQRTPPALIAFNTTGGQNIPSDIIEMCTGPTFLVMDPPLRPDGDDGTDKLLFVNCFESGQVYVVDPYVARIVAIIEVGRGPAGFVLPQAQQGQQGQQGQPHPDFGYVVGFGSNNVSVVDLRPMLDGQLNRTQYHVIERIGFPDPVPR